MKLSQALNERLALLAMPVSEALNQIISGVLRKWAFHELLKLALELEIKVGQSGRRRLQRRPEMVGVEPRSRSDLQQLSNHDRPRSGVLVIRAKAFPNGSWSGKHHDSSGSGLFPSLALCRAACFDRGQAAVGHSRFLLGAG